MPSPRSRADRRPGAARAPAATHRRRPGRGAARRAPGRAFCSCSPWCARCCSSSSYFASRSGDDPDTFLGLGASNVALGLSLGGALLFIGIGVIQWARKLMGDARDRRDRHPAASSPEDREETLAALAHGARRVRHRPPAADPQHPARRGRPGRPGRRSSRCATWGRCPATRCSSTIWTKGMRVVRDVVGHPDPGLRARSSATWSTRSPRRCSTADADGEPAARASSSRSRRPSPR